ncbi:MAG TPA: HAD-IA family hydrolase [bacterium]|nr:HAD-IA family hydrolase [bacterium]
MAIKTIFFDAGGTLIFIDYDYIIEVLKRHGITLDQEDLMRGEYAGKFEVDRRILVEKRRDGLWDDLFGIILRGAGVPDELVSRVMPELEKEVPAAGLWRWVRPETANLLRDLRSAGYTLGVISNSDGRVAQLLEGAGLAPYLDVIIDSAVVGVEKPDRRIFDLALQRVGISAQEALFTGDIYSVDILGAQSANVQGILFDPLRLYDHVNCPRIHAIDEIAVYAGQSSPPVL